MALSDINVSIGLTDADVIKVQRDFANLAIRGGREMQEAFRASFANVREILKSALTMNGSVGATLATSVKTALNAQMAQVQANVERMEASLARTRNKGQRIVIERQLAEYKTEESNLSRHYNTINTITRTEQEKINRLHAVALQDQQRQEQASAELMRRVRLDNINARRVQEVEDRAYQRQQVVAATLLRRVRIDNINARRVQDAQEDSYQRQQTSTRRNSWPGKVDAAIGTTAAYATAGALGAVAAAPGYYGYQYANQGITRQTSVANAFSLGGGKGMFTDISYFSDAITKVANKTGMAASEVDRLAMSIAQAGISSSQSEKVMLEMSKILRLSFGELDPSSAIQGFNTLKNTFFENSKLAEDALFSNVLKMLGKFVALANSSASSAREIVEAVAKVGGAATLGGFSAEKTGALLVAAQERSGVGADMLATTLKRTVSRVYSPDIISDIKGYGITIRDEDTNRLKSQYEIIGAIAAKYKELTAAGDMETASKLAMTAAGNVQYSNFVQILAAWEKGDELLLKLGDSEALNAKILEDANNTVGTSFLRLNNSLDNASVKFLSTSGESDILRGSLDLLGRSIDYVGSGGMEPALIAAGSLSSAAALGIAAMATSTEGFAVAIAGLTASSAWPVFLAGLGVAASVYLGGKIVSSAGEAYDANTLAGKASNNQHSRPDVDRDAKEITTFYSGVDPTLDGALKAVLNARLTPKASGEAVNELMNMSIHKSERTDREDQFVALQKRLPFLKNDRLVTAVTQMVAYLSIQEQNTEKIYGILTRAGVGGISSRRLENAKTIQQLMTSQKITREQATAGVADENAPVAVQLRNIKTKIEKIKQEINLEKAQGIETDIHILKSKGFESQELVKKAIALGEKFPSEERDKPENKSIFDSITNVGSTINSIVDSKERSITAGNVKALAQNKRMESEKEREIKVFWENVDNTFSDGLSTMLEKRVNSISGFIDYAIDAQLKNLKDVDNPDIKLDKTIKKLSNYSNQLTAAMFSAGGMTGAIPGMTYKSNAGASGLYSGADSLRGTTTLPAWMSSGLMSGIYREESGIASWSSAKEKKIELTESGRIFSKMQKELEDIDKNTLEIAKEKNKLSPFEKNAGGMLSQMMSGKTFSSGDLFGQLLSPLSDKAGGNFVKALTRVSVGGNRMSLDDIVGLMSGDVPKWYVEQFSSNTASKVSTASPTPSTQAQNKGLPANYYAQTLSKKELESAAIKKLKESSFGKGMEMLATANEYYTYVKMAQAILKASGIGTDRIRQDDRSTVDSQNTLISDLFNSLKSRGTDMTSADIAATYGYTPSYSTAVKSKSKRVGLHGLFGGTDTSYTNNNAGLKSIDELYKMTYDAIINAGEIELELRNDEIGQLAEKLDRTETMIEMNKKTNGKLSDLADSEVSAMKLRQQIYDSIITNYEQAMGFSSSQTTMRSYATKYGLASPITNKNFGNIQTYAQTSVVGKINELAQTIISTPPKFGSGIVESLGDDYARKIINSLTKIPVAGAQGNMYTSDPLKLGTTMYALSDMVDKFNSDVASGVISKDSTSYNALLEMVNLTTDLVNIQRAALENMIETNRKKIEYSDYLSGTEVSGESMSALELSTGINYSDFIKNIVPIVGSVSVGGEGGSTSYPFSQKGNLGSKYKYREQAINDRISSILGYSDGAFGTSFDILSNLYNTDWLNTGITKLGKTADDALVTEVKGLFSELQSSMSTLMGTYASDKSSSSAAKNEESKLYEVNSTGKYYITQNFKVESTYFGGSQAEAVQFLKFLSKSWNDAGLKNSGSKLF
jgi:hypothetical protein